MFCQVSKHTQTPAATKMLSESSVLPKYFPITESGESYLGALWHVWFQNMKVTHNNKESELKGLKPLQSQIKKSSNFLGIFTSTPFQSQSPEIQGFKYQDQECSRPAFPACKVMIEFSDWI